VWPTYLFVAGSVILLQCLSMIHKTGTNLRNDEIWRLLIFGADTYFGELDDKKSGPNHWKRNNFTWNLLQKCAVSHKALGYHTHLLHIVFAWSFNKAIRKKNVAQHELRKMSIKFHVPSLPKSQKVLLIFRNIGRSITDKNSFHVLLSRHFFSKHCSFTKIWSTFISFINFLSKFCNQK